MTEGNPIQVADRLFHTVELLADEGPLSLMEVAGPLRLNKSTAHRVLASLEYLGYVRQRPHDHKYELTYQIMELTSRLVRRNPVIVGVRPHLVRLMEFSGESVQLAKQIGPDAVFVDRVRSYRHTVDADTCLGSRVPLYRSAAGKAILAELPEKEIKELWGGSIIVKKTSHTITDYDAFLEELAEIRRRGYATNLEENDEGIRGIAVALVTSDPEERYAVSITASAERFDSARILVMSRYMLALKEELSYVSSGQHTRS